MGQRSRGSKVTHGEMKKCKILGLLCAEGTLGEFWRACRRRPNLAVGDAALRQGDAHMACRDDLTERGVYSQAIFHGPALFFNLMGR